MPSSPSCHLKYKKNNPGGEIKVLAWSSATLEFTEAREVDLDLAEGRVHSNKTAVLLSNTLNSASTLGAPRCVSQRRQIMQDRCGPSRFPSPPPRGSGELSTDFSFKTAGNLGPGGMMLYCIFSAFWKPDHAQCFETLILKHNILRDYLLMDLIIG